MARDYALTYRRILLWLIIMRLTKKDMATATCPHCRSKVKIRVRGKKKFDVTCSSRDCMIVLV